MPAITSIALGVSALGSVAGAVSGASDKTSNTTSRLEVDDPGAFEQSLVENQKDIFAQLKGLTQAGPGQSDVTASVGAQHDLANLLQQAQATSGLPTQSDIKRSQDLTQALFAPQRTALSQAFEEQGVQAGRQAAFLGREGNDPILAAKLAQSQTRQGALLESQQGAAAQQLAFQLPGQRLQFAGQRADVLGNLANQAFQTRGSLLAQGNQLSQQERAFRAQTGTQQGTSTQQGSAAQALAGGFAGLGQGLSAGAGIGKLFGGSFNSSGFFGGNDFALQGIQNIQSTGPVGSAQFSQGSGFKNAPTSLSKIGG